MTVTLADIESARKRISASVRMTPCLRSATLSELTGADIYLKFENQQFTAAFKERGALNFLLQLSAEEKRRGVIAMSAGNHAQAVAYHANRLGIPACIVMPRTTPNVKVEQTRVLGAEVLLHGSQLHETLEITQKLADERKLLLVHPYDDADVIAGQGTIGLELLEQVPDMQAVIVPVGGGGLIAGISTAIKSRRRDVELIGVQAERCPGAHFAFHGVERQSQALGTVAEGIAVKSPGQLTSAIIKSRVDDIVLVTETQIEQAIFSLLEIEKTVTEGAGAASYAAVTAFPERFEGRKVILVLSGGNIDMMVLSSVLQRGLVRTHRLVRMSVEISDFPGGLARLTERISELDCNIIDLSQERTFGVSSAGTTIVQVELQMRGQQQIGQLMRSLAGSGYNATLDTPFGSDDQ